jgi:hypothetical protein
MAAKPDKAVTIDGVRYVQWKANRRAASEWLQQQVREGKV